MAEPILACRRWRHNAEFIAKAVHPLGYIDDSDEVLDATYGKGNFWKLYRPPLLVANDRYVYGPEIDLHEDFRHMALADDFCDVAVLDAPYVAKGGRSTIGVKVRAMDAAYGIGASAGAEPRTPEECQTLINGGMTEMVRVARKRILVKTKPYISSGRYFDSPGKTSRHAEALGLELVDYFIFEANKGGPQPKTNPNGSLRRQVHARNNYSVLFVLDLP